MSIQDCELVQLPQVTDSRGHLTFIENNRHITFEIKRVFYIYDLPSGVERGGHANKKMQEFLIAISGSFDIMLDDGYKKKKYHLNRPNYGLYICPMIWSTIDQFSPGSVCLALVSTFYDESDYYRHYPDFIQEINDK